MGMSWFVDVEVRQSSDIETEVVIIFIVSRPSEFIMSSFCRCLVTMANGDRKRSSVIKT